MAARTVILLPPSEGKSAGGRGRPWAPGRSALPGLDAARATLLAALGPDHAVHTAPTVPAMRRYTGVLYRELDAASLSTEGRRRLNRSVLVVSGLWGLVAPGDPIPDYRLKMGARLDGVGPLARWWRPQLTAALAPRVDRAVVWDLLPNEHAAAVDWSALSPRRRVTVRFLDRDGKVVSHWNKLLKGSIVRWLVESGEQDPAALRSFDHPQGYRLDEAATVVDGRTTAVVLRELG